MRQSNYCLIDCNQFFVSCEQLFNPKLRNRPVVVLSNNDGCVVARSAQAKALNIPMGAPFYQCAEFFKRHDVFVCSSNYALYGDLSQRVMAVLQHFSPDLEEYSIDEAFMLLKEGDPMALAQEIQRTVLQWTGIPVSLGIGPTKTLAKVANDIAKNNRLKRGLCALIEEEEIRTTLTALPVEAIWGIGSRLGSTLRGAGLFYAEALREASDAQIQRLGSVTLLRTVWELRGIPSLSLQEQPLSRQSITRSRSFGTHTSAWSDLAEALSTYTAQALEQLREEKLLPSFLTVFLMTSAFAVNTYSDSTALKLIEPTHYTPTVIALAKEGLQKIYRSGYVYKKVGVILGGLTPEESFQPDLFTPPSGNREKHSRAMQLCDQLNQSFGKRTLHFAAEGTTQRWKMRQENVSPRFTTEWKELLTIRI